MFRVRNFFTRCRMNNPERCYRAKIRSCYGPWMVQYQSTNLGNRRKSYSRSFREKQASSAAVINFLFCWFYWWSRYWFLFRTSLSVPADGYSYLDEEIVGLVTVWSFKTFGFLRNQMLNLQSTVESIHKSQYNEWIKWFIALIDGHSMLIFLKFLGSLDCW